MEAKVLEYLMANQQLLSSHSVQIAEVGTAVRRMREELADLNARNRKEHKDSHEQSAEAISQFRLVQQSVGEIKDDFHQLLDRQDRLENRMQATENLAAVEHGRRQYARYFVWAVGSLVAISEVGQMLGLW